MTGTCRFFKIACIFRTSPLKGNFLELSLLSGQPVEIFEAVLVTNFNLISNTVLSVDLVGLNSKYAKEFSSLAGYHGGDR